jgi:hypothetical protein
MKASMPLAMLFLGPGGSALSDDVAKPGGTGESEELKSGKERLQECRRLFSEGKQIDAKFSAVKARALGLVKAGIETGG